MSLFIPINLVCPACEHAVVMDAVGSVNADRRPDFREDILEDRFQDVTCENCDETFRLQPKFNYLDAGRRQWIAAFPSAQILDWVEAESEVAELFATSYGNNAPEAAQAVGAGLDVRLTFGWPAIREKILAREHNLDDAILEIIKLDLVRAVDSAPVSTGVEIRLVSANAEALTFVWLDGPTEKPIQEIQMPMEHYLAVGENLEPWEKIREKLTDSIFVDMQKLFMGEGRAAAE